MTDLLMALAFTAILLKYGPNGEKTGWTYLELTAEQVRLLKPDQRTSFRVQGTLDTYPIRQVALMPIGDGTFILPINAAMRRGIRKEAGTSVQVWLTVDESTFTPSADLLLCLADDPVAEAFFNALAAGHQRYFSNWIDSAKTADTRARRIAQAVTGCSLGLSYSEMIRHFKAKK